MKKCSQTQRDELQTSLHKRNSLWTTQCTSCHCRYFCLQ